MPRALCLGNGNLQVNIDNDMNIRDLFFAFVGLENHVGGHFYRFGVWVDGNFSWIDDSWTKRLTHKEDSLVTDVTLKKSDLQRARARAIELPPEMKKKLAEGVFKTLEKEIEPRR